MSSWTGGSFELAMVVRVSWTIVPFGLGVTGFMSNMQVVFAGRPEQLSVKLMFEPAGANRVRGMTSFCPRVTLRCVGGGANPATTTVKGDEFPGANFESPSYCARMKSCPAANEEVVNVACPPGLNVPAPSKIPLAKKVTVPVGIPAVVLVAVAVSMTGCCATAGVCS